jgi:hypothetical protein
LLPHDDEQSESLPAPHVGRQHPSALTQVVIAVCTHRALQAPAVPISVSTVQGFPSSQLVGQFPSQSSVPSTVPFPQAGAQSPSFVVLHPVGQHISAPPQAVIVVCTHCASQVALDPTRVSVVQ